MIIIGIGIVAFVCVGVTIVGLATTCAAINSTYE